MKIENEFNPNEKKILVVSAHPDDVDFCAGGTLIKWLSEGAKAAIVICTNGDKGTSDRSLTSQQLSRTRREEQLAASQFLGLEKTWFLDYPDAHLEVTQEFKSKLTKIIREYKPDVVLTFDPTISYSTTWWVINHPDHRAVGQATLDAVYPMARDFLTFPEDAKEGLEPYEVCDVFLYNLDNPNFYIDITSTMERKVELLSKHPSQVNLKEVEPWVKKWNSQAGEKLGTSYAESFVHLRQVKLNP